jgi:hypothetical protein
MARDEKGSWENNASRHQSSGWIRRSYGVCSNSTRAAGSVARKLQGSGKVQEASRSIASVKTSVVGVINSATSPSLIPPTRGHQRSHSGDCRRRQFSGLLVACPTKKNLDVTRKFCAEDQVLKVEFGTQTGPRDSCESDRSIKMSKQIKARRKGTWSSPG